MKKIANLTLRYKFQQALTALVAVTSLYVANNMDDGDYFDLHKDVPQMTAQAAKQHPEVNPAVITADLADYFNGMENIVLFMVAVCSLHSGLKMHRLGQELKDAQGQKNTLS